MLVVRNQVKKTRNTRISSSWCGEETFNGRETISPVFVRTKVGHYRTTTDRSVLFVILVGPIAVGFKALFATDWPKCSLETLRAMCMGCITILLHWWSYILPAHRYSLNLKKAFSEDNIFSADHDIIRRWYYEEFRCKHHPHILILESVLLLSFLLRLCLLRSGI